MQRDEDLEPIDIKKQLEDDTVNSARSALANVVQSKQIGADTLAALESQSKQIDGMQRNVEKILQDQKTAAHKARTIGSLFGAIMNAFRGEPVIVRPQEPTPTVNPPARMRIKIEDEPASSTTSRDETSAILSEISTQLDDINAMAVQMNSEIATHSNKLQKLSGTTQQANANMEQLNNNVSGLIRKM